VGKARAIAIGIIMPTAVALGLFITVGTAPLAQTLSAVFENVFVLAAIAMLSFVVTLIGFAVILTTDNEYVAAIATVIVYISVVVLLTSLPTLIDAMSRYIGQALSNFTKVFG
jgi:hypothetical protein